MRVEPVGGACQRPLIGNWKASATATAAIIAAPCLASRAPPGPTCHAPVAARGQADRQPRRPPASLATAASAQRPMASAAAMNSIGITVAL